MPVMHLVHIICTRCAGAQAAQKYPTIPRNRGMHLARRADPRKGDNIHSHRQDHGRETRGCVMEVSETERYRKLVSACRLPVRMSCL